MPLRLRKSSEAAMRPSTQGETRHFPSDIVALVTSTGPWSPAVMAAFALAKQWDSHVTGCFVDPVLRSMRGLDTEPSVMSLLLDIPRDTRGESEAFETLAQRYGVFGATWMSTRTGLARTMHQLGAWHDLIVLERDIAEEESGLELLGEALLCCRRRS